jgi:hypothetical protein
MKIEQETYPENHFKLRPWSDKPRFFCFIEYGHDRYQKNPLSMEISKMSSYLADKIHLEKVTGQNVVKN